VKPLKRFVPPLTVRVEELGTQKAERDLRPMMVGAAVFLALSDLIITARLTHALLVLCLIAFASQAGAAESWSGGLATRLAYVETGNARLDSKSRTGLAALTEVLAARSTASLAAPVGVRFDRDTLAFYPLLYWPITTESDSLSEIDALSVKRYLKRGGMILFDRQDGTVSDPAIESVLKRLNRQLDLPPMILMGVDHVLTRSFYLLRSMPGRFVDGPIWVQADSADNDGVATVILGSNDWAGEWAGLGDPANQEMAFRFGVNLSIYALTGNYKADQVHLPAILERLGQDRTGGKP
jgi:hypothetical protein